MIALIVGVVVTFLGIAGIVKWFDQFKTVIEGAVPAMLVCGGILAIIAGITSIKDAIESKKLDQEKKESEKK